MLSFNFNEVGGGENNSIEGGLLVAGMDGLGVGAG